MSNPKRVDWPFVLIGAILIIIGILLKMFYVGTPVDAKGIVETIGTSKRSNIISGFLILLLRFASSSWGYISLIVLGSLTILLSIDFKRQNHD